MISRLLDAATSGYFFAVSIMLAISFSLSANATTKEKQMVVTATRVALPANALGSAVTVITASDIARSGALFVSDVLRQVPGLAVSSSGTPATLTSVRARGAEADHTQVFIDGIEMNDPASNSAFNFGLLTSNNIERIEVIRGAQSALTGSGAIGAVINIITKKGEGPLSISADLAGGTFNTHKRSIGASYRDARVDYNINAAILDSNGSNIARDGDEEDGYKNDTYDINLGLRPTEFLEFRASGRYTQATLDSDGFGGSGAVVDSEEGGASNRRVYLTSVARLSLFEDRWQQKLGFTSTRTHNKFFPSSFQSEGKRQKYSYQSDFYFTDPNSDATQYLSLLIERQLNDATTNTGTRISSWSYAAEYHITPFDQLSIIAGVRHDNNAFFEDDTTYRINTSYSWDASGTRLHAHYGTANKNPTMAELFGTFSTFVSNPNLKQEQSKNWDIGITQSLFDQYIFGITYYNNKITDRIASASTPAGQSTVANQAGTSPIYGVETTLDAKINNNIDLLASYTYTHARDTNDQALIRRPQTIATLQLSYTTSDDKANVNLGIHYNGKRKDTIFSFPSSTTTLPSFTLVNLNASYRLNKLMKLYSNIENLLDKRYEEIYSYQAQKRAIMVGIKIDT